MKEVSLGVMVLLRSKIGISGLITAVFLIMIVIASLFTLYMAMRTNEELGNAIRARFYELKKAEEISKSLVAIYEVTNDVLNITTINNYVAPVRVNAYLIIYKKGGITKYAIISNGTSSSTDITIISGSCPVPLWLNPGSSTSCLLRLGSGVKIISIKSIVQGTTLAPSSKVYKKPTPTVTTTPAKRSIPWTEPLRYRVLLNIKCDKNKVMLPFAVRINFTAPPINFNDTVDPGTIVITDDNGYRLPLTVVEVSNNTYWLVFPISLPKGEERTYVVYFDTEVPEGFQPPPSYYVTLARPKGGGLEVPHRNLDYSTFRDSGVNGNIYVALAVDLNKLLNFSLRGEEVTIGSAIELPFTYILFGEPVTTMYVLPGALSPNNYILITS